jgi:hypothetical protein
MSKFKVKVKVIAACEYEVEMDTDTEAQAENGACGQWREKLPDDFQIDKGYITKCEVEAEQLTAVCPGCGVEHAILHDDLPVCYCGQFGHNPYPTEANRRPPLRPHLIVNDVCTPEPWWWDDHDYCAACGAKIEQEEKANG